MPMTPMMQQYYEIKEKHADALLFFRLGDFYEMFGEDAKTAAPLLDITLTKRNRGTENEVDMCGIPHHAMESYASKLLAAQKKIAICDQISDPSLPGIVKRAVTRILTPGTSVDEQTLQPRQSNYLACVIKKRNVWGFAYSDISTGEMHTTEFTSLAEILTELKRLNPSETIGNLSAHEALEDWRIQPLSEKKQTLDILKKHYRTGIESLGLQEHPTACEAVGFILSYVQETQKQNSEHLSIPKWYDHQKSLVLDVQTLQNLELIQNKQGRSQGSLLDVLDKTVTAAGSRLLRQWMLTPSTDMALIQSRLEAVSGLMPHTESLRQILTHIHDIARIIGRMGTRRVTPSDLWRLRDSLSLIPSIKHILIDSSTLIATLQESIQTHTDIQESIQKTIDPEAVSHNTVIAPGFNSSLDEYRALLHSGTQWIQNFQQQEIEKTGIKSLKVQFNKVFGYYITISKANLENVPAEYIRKQTLVNAERFITPELKEYETKVLEAQEKITQLEQQLYTDFVESLITHLSSLQKTAQALAILDVLSNFSYLAIKYNYTKPQLTPNHTLHIQEGRHPVIERLQPNFVPNDIALDDTKRIMIVTGPNMAGKSSYLRQNALIIYMAHLGCFVPAKQALIPMTDRIFTRIGSADHLAAGQSTFMVEMQETASILNQMTQNSFVILDELGRGTSTYDGVSIAWSVTEYLHHKTKAFVLFATHYHELIALSESLPHLLNASVLVKEDEKGIQFLYKIVPGGTDKSYGIEVAKLAGLPKEIIENAQKKLSQLGSVSVPRQKNLF